MFNKKNYSPNGDYIANPYFAQFRMSPTPSTRGRHNPRFRSHHDSLNDTSSIASTPTMKSLPLEDTKKVGRPRRGRPRRVGRPRRESYEAYYDDNEDDEMEDAHGPKSSVEDTRMAEDHKSYAQEDEIVDVVNDDDNGPLSSPLNENVCIHCQSVDPPENLIGKIDSSIQPQNMVIKCSVCHRNQHPCCCDIYDPYMISKILR